MLPIAQAHEAPPIPEAKGDMVMTNVNQDSVGTTGHADTETHSLKRPERPATEKVSPEKKMLRVEPTPVPMQPCGDDTSIAPRALSFEGEVVNGSGASSQAPPPPPGLEPSPAIDQPTLAALLRKIAELESKVAQPPQPVPSQEGVKTPVKPRVLESPSTETSTSASSKSDVKPKKVEAEPNDDAEPNDGDGADCGELLVMPSGSAVT